MKTSNWYQRDASWVDRPNISSKKKLHLANKNFMPLCGRRAMLNEDSEFENPPEWLKCKNCLIRSNK